MTGVNSSHSEPIRINLGSGKDRKEGFVNVDWDRATLPEVVHDLNSLPYPFPDNAASLIVASHVLEHLDRPFAVMRELHRILAPDGILIVKVPHMSRGFTHAEHCHGFDVTFPLYFRKDFLGSGYQGFEFDLEHLRFKWSAFSNLLPNLGYGRFTQICARIVSAALSWLANLNPYLTSRLWCYWVGGFEELEFRFVCRK